MKPEAGAQSRRVSSWAATIRTDRLNARLFAASPMISKLIDITVLSFLAARAGAEDADSSRSQRQDFGNVRLNGGQRIHRSPDILPRATPALKP